MKILCLLVALFVAAHAKNSFVIVAPGAVRSSMAFRAVVHIYANVKKPTLVSLSIHGDGKKLVHKQMSIKRSQPRLITLLLPRHLKAGKYSLLATGKQGLTFKMSKSLRYLSKEKSLFIQSDKAIYKPGDKIQFRTVGLFPTLKPYTGKVNISIYDSASNKIQQWLDQDDRLGVVGKEFDLSPYPVLGDWKIKVDAGPQSVEKKISIAKYVLPKFQVEVRLPPFVVADEKEISFTVKSTYTYGKPLYGRVHVAAKLLFQGEDYESSDKKEFFTFKGNTKGELKVSIPMKDVKKVRPYFNNFQLAVKAEVVESLTGNVMKEYGYVTIYNSGVKIFFPPINPDTFKPRLSYTGYLSVTKPDGMPLEVLDKEVEVLVKVTEPLAPLTTPSPVTFTHGEIKTKRLLPPHFYPQEKTYTHKVLLLSVPGNGLAVFSFAVPPKATRINLQATYRKVKAYATMRRSRSPSDTYMQVSLQNFQTINAGDTMKFSVVATMPLPSLVFSIMSRGEQVMSGVVHGLQRKLTSFTVEATPLMGPNARLIVYFARSDGEIVVDTIGFDVAGSFRNPVNIKFSQSEAEPGDEVRLRMTARENSRVFLLAIDQSVLLLKSGNDITPTDIHDELETYDSISHGNEGIFRSSPAAIAAGIPREANFRMGRSIWWPFPIFYGGIDAARIFGNAGVVVISDSLIYRYVPPPQTYPKVAFRGNKAVEDGSVAVGGGLQAVDRIRTEFPETWIWTDIKTCVSGQATVVAKVPDTITSWIASAFAVHQHYGFGISPDTAKLTVFKPFFVSLNLAYSVIRGEQVAIQAIVFNYLKDDQMVRVTLARSEAFYSVAIDCNGVEDRLFDEQAFNIFVEAGQAKSVYFPIVPVLLGSIDIEVRAQSHIASDGLRRQILVLAEGFPMEFNEAVLIDLSGINQRFSRTLHIKVPENIVEGSAVAKLSVVGDIMGPTLTGLDKLLVLPTGCGEQTLIRLAPNIYITGYLKKTNQLTGAIADKAISFMLKGYQQELTFKHKDGSFSAFGSRDKSGSMWLTAFVAKVFHQAMEHIFIDTNVIRGAIRWIISHQDEDGSFPEPGRVIHKNMQGRASSGGTLTTFVLICLYENEDIYAKMENEEADDYYHARDMALLHVEEHVLESDDLYLLTMASYAFQLANSSHLSDLLLTLSETATREEGLTYWHLPEEEIVKPGIWHPPHHKSAIDTEMTSYVLLTLAIRKDLSRARSILQWVTRQRNARGGFGSTQDTVVALQALAEVAELVYNDKLNVNIKVGLDDDIFYTFKVNAKNAIISQRRQAKFLPAKVEVVATGVGVALVELGFFFNVWREVEDKSYSLDLKILKGTLNHFTLQVCTRRLGGKVKSGMVVAVVGIVSGFEVDEDSVSNMPAIRKFETEPRKVTLYFDEITYKKTCFAIRMDRIQLVAKAQPATVHIFDYYEPNYQVKGSYTFEIVKQASICTVCKHCPNCPSIPKVKAKAKSVTEPPP